MLQLSLLAERNAGAQQSAYLACKRVITALKSYQLTPCSTYMLT